jgi:hypothetical protein
MTYNLYPALARCVLTGGGGTTTAPWDGETGSGQEQPATFVLTNDPGMVVASGLMTSNAGVPSAISSKIYVHTDFSTLTLES